MQFLIRSLIELDQKSNINTILLENKLLKLINRIVWRKREYLRLLYRIISIKFNLFKKPKKCTLNTFLPGIGVKLHRFGSDYLKITITR